MKAAYLVVLLVALLLVGCASEVPEGTEGEAAEGGAAEGGAGEVAEPEAPASASVDVTRAAFDPEEVTIKAGGKITWKNADEKKQIIAGPKGTFTETLEPGATYSYTFDEAGEYQIMNVLYKVFGKVIVE